MEKKRQRSEEPEAKIEVREEGKNGSEERKVPSAPCRLRSRSGQPLAERQSWLGGHIGYGNWVANS